MGDQPFRAVYLDGHATTPLAPEASAAMDSWWHESAANAHSPHSLGLYAAAAVDSARLRIANLINVDPQEIVFTSGATEANNIAILGIANAASEKGNPRREIVVSAVEHKSVLESAKSLISKGFKVRIAPVDSDGRIDIQAFAGMLSNATLLVSVMGANNETGTIQPLAELLPLVRGCGAMFHIDGAQLVGRLPFDAADFDLVSLSSHKMYGPMGVGALFVSSAARLRPLPLFYGGGQEAGLRPGTLPTPLIVGFGVAASLAAKHHSHDVRHMSDLTQRLIAGLEANNVAFERTVNGYYALPGSISIRFLGVEAISLINDLSTRICISDGSACSSGQIQTSYVLKALNKSEIEAAETVRICCGRYNTVGDIDCAIAEIVRSTTRLSLAHWTNDPVGIAHEGHFR